MNRIINYSILFSLSSLFAYLVLAISCASSIPTNQPVNTVQAVDKQINNSKSVNPDLERNRGLWREKGITDYNFISSIFYHRLHNPAVPVLIKVQAAKNISIEPISKSDQGSLEEYKRFDTIEKMFETIDQMLETGEKVTVKYNKEVGYPEEIVVDEPKEGGVWFVMNIKKFEVIK